MKMFKYCAKQLPLLILSLMFVVGNLPGCAGGGTSGSGGGGGLQFSGLLLLQQGTPAAGVTVTAAAQPAPRVNAKISNTAVTDDTGAFTLFVDATPSDDVKLSFKGPTIASSYVVTKIPPAAAIVKINLTYDEDTSSINEDDVKYEDDHGGEVRDDHGSESQGQNQSKVPTKGITDQTAGHDLESEDDSQEQERPETESNLETEDGDGHESEDQTEDTRGSETSHESESSHRSSTKSPSPDDR